jgi:hypothetical protein
VRYIILGALIAIPASAAPIQFQSTERQVSLVELYTSEGCSSCPPAESWMSKLEEKPGLWSDFVPVAFHVDYWDRLGWRDKWSSKQYSDRQRDYAAAWDSDTIYTPEFVINGKEWHNWFEMRGAPQMSGNKTGVLKAASEDTRHWQVIFMPVTAAAIGFDVNAALLISGLGSDVRGGENSGRHLQHDFAVLKLIRQPLAAKDNLYQADFVISAGPNAAEDNLALAVWITRNGSLEPVQAVGGSLAPSEKINEK